MKTSLTTPLPDFNDNPAHIETAPLKERDVEQYFCRPLIHRLLKYTAERLGKAPDALRILDYGCGRGELVGFLRRAGYDCYGVDIEASYIENARGYFPPTAKSTPIMSCMDGNRSLFEDRFFDVIVTTQVLEHVKSIEPVLTEISRLLATDGVCLHIFPPSLSVMEQHMFLPFVHWLPGNRSREALIRAMLAVGMGAPYFKEFSTPDRARIFFAFSVTDTIYRTYGELIRLLSIHGFVTRDIAREKLLYRGGIVARVMTIPVIGRIAGWLYSHFHQTYLLTAKNARGLAIMGDEA